MIYKRSFFISFLLLSAGERNEETDTEISYAGDYLKRELTFSSFFNLQNTVNDLLVHVHSHTFLKCILYNYYAQKKIICSFPIYFLKLSAPRRRQEANYYQTSFVTKV